MGLPRARSALLVLGLAIAREARAEPPPSVHEEDDDLGGLDEETLGPRGNMRTRAESVSFDARERSLELSGNVRVDAPPFHLRAHRLKLARTRWGIEADGQGRLAFCPCLGTPLTVEFEKAIVAPPGELFLKSPRLEVYGVPVMWLPWFWLRGGEKVGVLPPDIAYRGRDGMFLGDGVHLPWKKNALDLRAGAYLTGGFAADARLRTPTSLAKVRYDRLESPWAPRLFEGATDAEHGLFVDARGSRQADGAMARVAWDADVLRGRRGVAATTDLDTAAKPWDRAAASAVLPLPAASVETGFRVVTRRGGDLDALDAAGPYLAVRSSGAALPRLTYDAGAEGGSLRVAGGPDAIQYVRGEIGLRGSVALGPGIGSVSLRGAADGARRADSNGADLTSSARVRYGVPLGRAYAGDLLHVLEPFAEGAFVHASGDAILGVMPGRGMSAIRGSVPLVTGGLATTLGHWAGRDAVEVIAAMGTAFDDGAKTLARTRLAASSEGASARVETAHVVGDGSALFVRGRVGRTERVHLVVTAAARSGVDRALARAVLDPELEAPGLFYAARGTTGGAGVVVPWNAILTTSAGVDGDATVRELVAARAGFVLHDRCKCVALRMNGAHRIGRSGVDVWLALDFAADR